MHKNLFNENLTIQVANQRCYAFTLRRTNLKKGVTKEDYLGHWKRWPGVKLHDYIFEETAGLHMHGVVVIPVLSEKYMMKQFRIRGWNMELVEIWDEFGWKCYYMKDQKINEDEIEETAIIPDRNLFNYI